MFPYNPPARMAYIPDLKVGDISHGDKIFLDKLPLKRYCSRPFATVEDMNDEMVKRWNSVVRPDDIVYYLGDFSLAKRPVEYFAPLLHGEKHLIMGNHDPCHPLHKKKSALGMEVY